MSGLAERLVRTSWPVLAGVWGAWLGAQGYRGIPYNADSFATTFALAFFSVFALIGLGAGLLVGAALGRLSDGLLRRLGAGPPAALAIATVVTALACWQIGEVVQARFPGFGRPACTPATPIAKSPAENACASPPPEDPRKRRLWDSECR